VIEEFDDHGFIDRLYTTLRINSASAAEVSWLRMSRDFSRRGDRNSSGIL
jgi:hypothetical protein